MTKRIEYIIDEILDQYMYADLTFRPWIIAQVSRRNTHLWIALLQVIGQTIDHTTSSLEPKCSLYQSDI